MKKFLLFLFLLILLAAAYLTGSKGTNPTKWFEPPTPTPTFTATFTATSKSTATGTATFTPTATMTATPVPKKKPSKKAVKKKTKKVAQRHPQEVTDDTDEEPIVEKKAPPLAPPQPPERKPICNAPSLSTVIEEVEPNNTFATAQNLGDLTSAGLQVKGSLTTVVNLKDMVAIEGYKTDPHVETSEIDRDVYSFTTSSPFLVVLDCYTNVMGKPNPLYNEPNYQLEVYNESFVEVGKSLDNDPVESVEISDPGKTFYAVVYGVDGTGGNYRLTITRKETN
jgi:hypothetical protein